MYPLKSELRGKKSVLVIYILLPYRTHSFFYFLHQENIKGSKRLTFYACYAIIKTVEVISKRLRNYSRVSYGQT